MKDNSCHPKRSEDPDKAREMAEAERPFRDVVAEDEVELAEESKRVFEQVASKKGEAAGELYERRKTEEDPRIVALRERGRVLLQLKEAELGENVDPARLQRTQEILNAVGRKEIEAILHKDDLQLEGKMNWIESHIKIFHQGIESFQSRESPGDIDSKYRKAQVGYDPYVPFVLRGYLAGAIGSGQYTAGMVERSFSILYGYSTEKRNLVKENLEDFLPFIAKARELNPEDWDKNMRYLRYIWDDNNKQYVSLETR